MRDVDMWPGMNNKHICATATVGLYNGHLKHMEIPFVDGRLAVAKITTHKGPVCKPIDPEQQTLLILYVMGKNATNRCYILL